MKIEHWWILSAHTSISTLKQLSNKEIVWQHTVLPQRSLASMLALKLSNNLTTSTCPSQAAMCKAVRPSRSMLFTSTPSLRRSSTPLASPWHAMKRSCMVVSRFSGTPTCSPFTGLRRLGSSDDCRPKANRLALASLGSSEAWRPKLNLLFDSDLRENCRDTPRFSAATTSISASIRAPDPVKTQSLIRRLKQDRIFKARKRS